MIGRPKLFAQFTEGVNLESAPYDLSEKEARDARNVQATVRGAIRKRNGSVELGTAGVQLTSLYGASGVDFLIAAGGTQLFAFDPAGAATALIGLLTSGRQWSLIEAPVVASQGPVFGMNGVEARETDGTAGGTGAWTAATGTLPIGKYLAYHGNTVWVAGMASYLALVDPGSALVWCAPGAPRDWPAANVVLFAPGDGEDLQGVGACGSNLLVFKSDKSWLVYDLETGANRPLAENVGCVAHRSIVDTLHGTFFLSRDQGVMLTNGSSIQRVSDKVMPLLRLLPAADRQLASAKFFDGHYYLAISQGGGFNSLMLDYDVALKSWSAHTLAVADLATWEQGGEPRLYGPRAAASPVDRLLVPNVWTDDGVVYPCYWRGPFHALGSPYLRKRFHAIHFDGKGRIRVAVYKDFNYGVENLADVNFVEDTGLFGGAGTYGGSGVFGSEAEIGEQVILTPGVARALSVEISSETADAMELESYTLFSRDRTR